MTDELVYFLGEVSIGLLLGDLRQRSLALVVS